MRLFPLAMVLALALTAPARAVTIFDNLPANGSGSMVSNGLEQAESFVPSSSVTLGRVELSLSRGGTEQNLTLNVWDSSGALPGSTLIASVSLAGLVSTSQSLVGVDFAATPLLTGGATYWIAVATGANTTATWYDSLAGGSAPEPYRSGAGAWQSNSGTKGAFRVLGDPAGGGGGGTPEPATWILAAATLGIAGRRVARRRA